MARESKDRSHTSNEFANGSGSRVLGVNEVEHIHAVVPYEQPEQTGETVLESDHGHQRYMGDGINSEERKKLASTIVSPALRRPAIDDNVTIRSRSAAKSLMFSPQEERIVDKHEPIIDALSDMEIQENDLFDDELHELENAAISSSAVSTTKRKYDPSVSKRGIEINNCSFYCTTKRQRKGKAQTQKIK
ncbi:unnamed protein product [Eruca vesicaria subsp. sativa]|uniref:Uncharacterized protein n=1 Tax=Eruca vesicaria subsp. sativa TaxID=29727 RepID=A0ABC8JH05_ERUVS|nr:unnamed protein product [Eruca vesicaria subsp. sativa]